MNERKIDTTRPHPARIYDYLLGGTTNYEVDREIAKKLPPTGWASARLNREFMHRALAWLPTKGIDQYLDIGTGIPTEPNLHQIVQRIKPESRIVYTDHDPLVLAHAGALLLSRPEGLTEYIEADVREPEKILEHAMRLLDFDRPIALSLIALMHFIPDDMGAYEIVRALIEPLAPGSYLVLSNIASDIHQEEGAKVVKEYKEKGIPLALRTQIEVAQFFEGLDIVAPGVVTAPHWFKDTHAPKAERSGIYVGVGRVSSP